MLTRFVVCTALCVVAAPAPGMASAAQAERGAKPQVVRPATPSTVRLEGTGYEIAFESAVPLRSGKPPSPALLRAIAAWLARTYSLPAIDAPPAVKVASGRAITTFRFTGLLSDDPRDHAAVPPGQRDVVSAYDELNRAIYLPPAWSGATAAELSVLVHEMVHHLQSVAGLRYECPQAREELAYAAQEKWLGMFGHSLAEDFELDAFTLLVSTRCPY